jgi:predicted esterase
MGATVIARLILWGGTLPKDLPDAKHADVFRGASVTLVGGRKDRLATPDAMEHDHRALAERGVPSTLVWHEGAHALSSATLREIAAAGAQ